MRIDRCLASHTLCAMGHDRLSKPFLETWLRRTKKQLAGSGRISELALILAREGAIEGEAMDQSQWRVKLQEILEGEIEPSLELLTKLDSLLAKRGSVKPKQESDGFLF